MRQGRSKFETGGSQPGGSDLFHFRINGIPMFFDHRENIVISALDIQEMII